MIAPSPSLSPLTGERDENGECSDWVLLHEIGERTGEGA